MLGAVFLSKRKKWVPRKCTKTCGRHCAGSRKCTTFLPRTCNMRDISAPQVRHARHFCPASKIRDISAPEWHKHSWQRNFWQVANTSTPRICYWWIWGYKTERWKTWKWNLGVWVFPNLSTHLWTSAQKPHNEARHGEYGATRAWLNHVKVKTETQLVDSWVPHELPLTRATSETACRPSFVKRSLHCHQPYSTHTASLFNCFLCAFGTCSLTPTMSQQLAVMLPDCVLVQRSCSVTWE